MLLFFKKFKNIARFYVYDFLPGLVNIQENHFKSCISNINTNDYIINYINALILLNSQRAVNISGKSDVAEYV